MLTTNQYIFYCKELDFTLQIGQYGIFGGVKQTPLKKVLSQNMLTVCIMAGCALVKGFLHQSWTNLSLSKMLRNCLNIQDFEPQCL